MPLELLSVLCTFENSSKCIMTSFDSNFVPRAFCHIGTTKVSCFPVLFGLMMVLQSTEGVFDWC